jgi:hypothetical protein
MVRKTVYHKGEPCFEETQNTSCPLYAQGILWECKKQANGQCECTHEIASSRRKTSKAKKTVVKKKKIVKKKK